MARDLKEEPPLKVIKLYSAIELADVQLDIAVIDFISHACLTHFRYYP
jgi:hypothetical protein